MTDYDEGGGSVEELASGASVITQALINSQAPVNIFYDRWVSNSVSHLQCCGTGTGTVGTVT